MKKLWDLLKNEAIRFGTDTLGQDLVEYALNVAAIALAMVAVVQSLAVTLSSIYASIVVGLQNIGSAV